MNFCLSFSHSVRARHCLTLATLVTTGLMGACAPAVATFAGHEERAASAQEPTGDLVPGVPNRPELVTVVPFYEKPNETQLEQTKAVIEAEIDGHRGVFIFDLGDEPMMLNRTFLQPNAAGGVDTVTDAHRTPDTTPRTNYMNPGNFTQFDKAHVTVRMGTLESHFDDSQLAEALGASKPQQYNVMLGHLWGNFGWVFGPRLGNIGPAAERTDRVCGPEPLELSTQSLSS